MTDDELRHWQEIDAHLTEISKHVGWGALVEYAHYELMDAPKRRILNSNVPDWDTYCKETGRLVGIHAILDAPKVVSKRVEDELNRRAAIAAQLDESSLSEV